MLATLPPAAFAHFDLHELASGVYRIFLLPVGGPGGAPSGGGGEAGGVRAVVVADARAARAVLDGVDASAPGSAATARRKARLGIV